MSKQDISTTKYHRKGFTLIELLVVISIIALLSSVVLASLTSARQKAQVGSGLEFAGHAYSAFGADAYLLLPLDGNLTNQSGYSVTTTVYNNLSPQYVNDSPSGSSQSYSVVRNDLNSLKVNFANTVQASDYTLNIWVKFLSTPANDYVVRIDGISWSTPVLLNVSSTKINYGSDWSGQFNGTNMPNITYSTPLNQWINFAITYNHTTNTNSLYINGHLQDGPKLATGSFPAIGYFTFNAVTIGTAGSGGVSAWMPNGYIDDVRLYNQSLSSANIQNIYALGAQKHGLTFK